jgi:transcriptional regulator with XRE-family HTH domain
LQPAAVGRRRRLHTAAVGRDDHLALGANFGARVRELRQERRWSLEALAHASGVSRSMLSEVERGEASPTLSLAIAIARALGTRLGDMVDGGHESELHVVRHNDPAYDYRTEGDCQIRTLSPLVPDRTIEYYRLDFTRGGELRSQPHFTGTREIVYVDVGRIRVESGGDDVVLTAGDSVTFAADVPHAIVNVGRSRARAYLIDVLGEARGTR